MYHDHYIYIYMIAYKYVFVIESVHTQVHVAYIQYMYVRV